MIGSLVFSVDLPVTVTSRLEEDGPEILEHSQAEQQGWCIAVLGSSVAEGGPKSRVMLGDLGKPWENQNIPWFFDMVWNWQRIESINPRGFLIHQLVPDQKEANPKKHPAETIVQ